MLKRLKIIGVIVIVFSFLLPVSFSSADTNQDKIEQLRKEIEELEKQDAQLQKEAEQYRGSIAETQAQANTLKNQIQNLKNQISAIESSIKLTGKKIDKTQVEIGGVQENILTTQEKMDYQRLTIGELLLYLAKRDNESLVGILMKSQNLSDYFNDAQYALTVNSTLLNIVEELQEAEKKLSDEKNELENKKKSLEELRQQESAQKASLANSTTSKNKILTTTKGQEAAYQKLLAETEERQRQANLEIFRLEDQLRRAIDPDSIPVAGSGILARPAEGTRTSQSYGCIETAFARRNYPSCNNKKGGFHNGLDLAAKYGTPIRVAEDGKVIAIGNAPYAYGVWAAIEHPSGLVTAYTHMSVRSVSVGQEVKRGDVVGNMGSTGLSTGSHIHFMVYAPKTFTTKQSKISGLLPIGATLNPSDYL